MIQLLHLTKRFHQAIAVDDLTLEVPAGEIFGFLGPNGAGKTTTIRLMMGLLRPTSGQVILKGYDLARAPLAAKALCGFVPDHPFLYEKLTGREFLHFVGNLYRMNGGQGEERIESLLHLFGLNDRAAELIESYSHGMKQRLVVAAALIHQPRILIIDEPMVGMDPQGVRLLKSLFRHLAAEGATIFLSTHSLEVAEELCDRIGIIHEGKLIAVGTLADLRALAGTEERLEAIFLKLTGAKDLEEVINALRA